MAMQYLHQAILRGEFQFLNPLFFQFFLRSQVQFVSKGLQLVLQLLVFEIKGSKFYVMSEELLDEFFLSAFHGSLLPVSKHWKLLPYQAGGGKAVPT